MPIANRPAPFVNVTRDPAYDQHTGFPKTSSSKQLNIDQMVVIVREQFAGAQRRRDVGEMSEFLKQHGYASGEQDAINAINGRQVRFSGEDFTRPDGRDIETFSTPVRPFPANPEVPTFGGPLMKVMASGTESISGLAGLWGMPLDRFLYVNPHLQGRDEMTPLPAQTQFFVRQDMPGTAYDWDKPGRDAVPVTHNPLPQPSPEAQEGARVRDNRFALARVFVDQKVPASVNEAEKVRLTEMLAQIEDPKIWQSAEYNVGAGSFTMRFGRQVEVHNREEARGYWLSLP